MAVVVSDRAAQFTPHPRKPIGHERASRRANRTIIAAAPQAPLRFGDYAAAGTNEISLVAADSFWVDGYFEESNSGSIQVGDPASVKLLGYKQVIRGHVGSIARGINVSNAQSNG